MTNERNVRIGRDAQGSIIATGDGNVFYLFLAEPSEALLAQIHAGQVKLAEVAEAIPLPTLTLAIAFSDDERRRWRITARRPNSEPVERPADVPWLGEPGFASALDTFWRLSRQRLEKDEDRRALEAGAHLLGEALGKTLLVGDVELLRVVARGDPPPPLLVIESDDDLILALPWELLRIDGRFAVADAHLDVARSVPAKGTPELGRPKEPVTLVVNLSAPEGSELDYEAESYAITRALHDHVGVRVNELGELDDLVVGLRADPAPIGVHFSGHGGPGTLVFEDQFGDSQRVPVDRLLTAIRKSAPERFPRFFYLACCHGGDPPALAGAGHAASEGLPATATALHREGVTQVVAYFGPVYDILSSWAEGVFYAEIGKGRRTRDALRAARAEMTRPLEPAHRGVLRDTEAPSGAYGNPFAWAQLVLYQRGPDHPLGTAVTARFAEAAEAPPTREVEQVGERTRLLKKGFVARRKELHALRRDLRAGRTVHVIQGLGGVGKSAFCGEALRLYERQGRDVLYLWGAEVEDDPDPVGTLLRQLSGQLEARYGDGWNDVVAEIDRLAAQQPALQQPARRLPAYLAVVLQQEAAPPLALYLDNLESLQHGPDTAEEKALGAWRDEACASLWAGLAQLARNSGGRLALLASVRYQHHDYLGSLVPFGPLPRDALWRLFGWFEALRRLAPENRARLVEQLAGHARAVEFLAGLVSDALRRWERGRGPRLPALSEKDAEREWAEIIEPELPKLADKLSEDLLFNALWSRVLDEPARELLVRATVLRRPADWGLMTALASSPEQAEAAIELLRRSALLTEIQERETAPRFEVHPNVATFALEQAGALEGNRLQREGHRRAGDFLERLATTSTDGGDDIEAAHHLAQVGEADRAFNLLLPPAQWLQDRGRLLDSLAVMSQLPEDAQLSLQNQGRRLGVQAQAWIGLGNLAIAGDLLQASMQRLNQQAAQDPGNAGWQRDLSIGFEKIGYVQRAKGDQGGALKAYRDSHAIREKLAAQDPGNALWQRDLSVSFERIGDVQSAQGDHGGALEAYRDSLAIREKLAAQDPGNAEWQRNLSVSFEKIGDVRSAKGDLDGALQAYRDSLAIREKLAEQDPGNAQWQYGLSIGFEKIGYVQCAKGDQGGALKAYRDSHAIREKLAAQDPGNALWQRDLSVSFERIGEVRSAQGDHGGALEAYRDSLAIREKLAAQDPGNAEWQRDLSVSFNKIGEVRSAQGDLDGALKAYRDSLAIREKLAAQDPGNAEWQRDLIVSHWRLADLAERRREEAEARRHYREALDVAVALRDGGRLAPVDGRMVGELEARLGRVSQAGAR